MVDIVELLNRLNECQSIFIKCDNIAQLKTLKHIQDNFSPKGVKHLELIENGIKLTDCTGAKADFIYDKCTGDVTLND